MKMIKFLILLIFTILVNSQNFVYGQTEPILITISDDRENVIFDGKWSSGIEWKKSSLNQFNFDDNFTIILRTAHQDDYIYALVDVVSDIHLDHASDKAVLCFDANNDKSKIPGSDDYCFGVSLGNKNGFVLQGDSKIKVTNNFKKITNPPDFIAVSSGSDENDRYSTIPHSSYEFKIPINILGRSDNYGFYLTVYDGYSDKFYSWPDFNPEKPFKIPSPNKWGDIVSPDKTIPEFNLPALALFPAILFVIYMTRVRKIN